MHSTLRRETNGTILSHCSVEGANYTCIMHIVITRNYFKNFKNYFHISAVLRSYYLSVMLLLQQHEIL